LTFWALDDISEECESMVLYFDGFGGGKEEEMSSSLMVVLEECFASLSSSSLSSNKDGDGDERGTRRREVRVKRFASSSGEMETIGEYVLCCCAGGGFDEKGEEEIAGGEGNCEVDEGVVVVANGGAAARRRRRRRRRSAASAASSPERTDPEKKKNKKNEKKKTAPMMDVIVLTSATGYDILSSFARSLKTKRGRAPLKTDEEKEAFLSSLVSSSSSPSPLSSPATVALIERELKTNFLKNQLPTPELLVVVSDVFSVGKFPGFLLSKCELAHFAPPPAGSPSLQSEEEKKKTRGGDDDAAATLARHRKILGEYLRSFQRFGA
jgi:hypothetical protein